MKTRIWVVVLAVAVLSVILYACTKSSTDGEDKEPDEAEMFKIAMLTNYADTLIIPAYTDLQEKLTALNVDVNAFLTSPSVGTQNTLKVSFKAAYIGYEKISLVYFGPAGATSLNNNLNIYPASVSRIESGITTGVYNFTTPMVSDSIQGFPALDYLFFSADAVTKFADAGASNRKKYVQDIMVRMKSLVDNVVAQWQTYRTGFIANTKLDVGSPIGTIINQMAYEMDQLKGPRIGWPFGKLTLGNIASPQNCEGYYGGFSAALAIANLTSLKNYYTGGSGRGIDDYLLLLNKSTLNNMVLARFDAALTALQAIPEPMSVSFVNSDKTFIEEAYTKVQLLLTAIKTDVVSNTGVRITYQDSDGD